MGFFGKIFEKKACANCGKELKLTGWRSLADGYLCKDCTGLLSPYFSERKESTTAEILQQLAYRRNNFDVVRAFHADERYGNRPCIEIDRGLNCMMVVRYDNPLEENPDVIDLNTVTDCRLHVSESRREVTYKDHDGKEMSYQPRCYQYKYDFELIITVDNPYFDKIRVDLCSGSIGGRDIVAYNRMADLCNAAQAALGIAPTPVMPPRMDDPLPPIPHMGPEHGPRGQMGHMPPEPPHAPAPMQPERHMPPQAPAGRPGAAAPVSQPHRPNASQGMAQPHRPGMPSQPEQPRQPERPERPEQPKPPVGGPRGPRG